jgi:hypothetical protein
MLPSEPLRIACRGLRTTDKSLRVTALEYLESMLPPEISKPHPSGPAALESVDRPQSRAAEGWETQRAGNVS